MEVLYFLESIRTPIVTEFMSAATYLGTQLVFLAIAIIVLWCVGKRQAYFIFVVSLAGTYISQFLKLVFCIPRPWVLDPNFSIVESAREMASGFSFPSGHTQGAVGAFGAIALVTERRWVRVVCIIVILLVPFSRMYLGVHTPLDVGAGFLCAVAMLALFWPCFKNEDRFHASMKYLLVVLSVTAVAFLIWVYVNAFPTNVDAENLTEGMKNAWSLLGCTLALAISYFVDEKWLHFDVKAPLPGQILKVVLGLLLLLGIIQGLKMLFIAIAGGALWTNAIRYGLAVIFACCIWPVTFPFFARIGAREAEQGAE
ncbi:MAG: phosphatase PAP2 family protein [Coriobacteriia bacterium]|nr:phosphatase PAP2 family protein [Coriobacteriia bacterium]